jgi:hypothetical protein
VKNQYFGDINDYRKYALLRALTNCGGIRTTICWMLTPDDGRGDGGFMDYLDKLFPGCSFPAQGESRLSGSRESMVGSGHWLLRRGPMDLRILLASIGDRHSRRHHCMAFQ